MTAILLDPVGLLDLQETQEFLYDRGAETLNRIPEGLHFIPQGSHFLLHPGQDILPPLLQSLQQTLEKPQHPLAQALPGLLGLWALNLQAGARRLLDAATDLVV